MDSENELCVSIRNELMLVGDRSPLWRQYLENLISYVRMEFSKVGCFGIPREIFLLNFGSHMVLPRSDVHFIKLPLRLMLASGDLLGCHLTPADIEVIVATINSIWYQAGILWEVVDTQVISWPDLVNDQPLAQIRDTIWSLHRGPDGKMEGKDIRRHLFVNTLLQNHSSSIPDCFSIWIFDYIGNGSQGCCIDRKCKTIIIGQRSTKGYAAPTVRPNHCLGKTCAHELGHALFLEHPQPEYRPRRGLRPQLEQQEPQLPQQQQQLLLQSQQQQQPQSPYLYSSVRDNLMTGGKDSNGGGGDFLEDWQIIIARSKALQ
jgi:hypothetical protein